MRIKEMKLSDLKPYEFNSNKHSKEQIFKLANMIKEFGFKVPIITDKDLVIIAGHGRLEAAKHLGLAKVPVHIAEELTAEKAKALRIAENRIQRDSEFDKEMLEKELKELENLGFDLALTAFDESELDKLLEDLEEEGLEEKDDDLEANLEIDRDSGKASTEEYSCTCPNCGTTFNLNRDEDY